jgi:membrane protease subunit HflK
MRKVIGRSNIQAILTGGRQTIETAVQESMQKTLDDYGASVLVQQVQLQKVDPPTQVIDAFRDVQAARSDLERAQNEAQTYANRVVPEARGRAAKNRRRSQGPDLALQPGLRAVQEMQRITWSGIALHAGELPGYRRSARLRGHL